MYCSLLTEEVVNLLGDIPPWMRDKYRETILRTKLQCSLWYNLLFILFNDALVLLLMLFNSKSKSEMTYDITVPSVF